VIIILLPILSFIFLTLFFFKAYQLQTGNHKESIQPQSKVNYYHIRALEREIWGETFTGRDGHPEQPTYLDEYYSKHPALPMVSPKPIDKEEWQDREGE
jgi:hypothetical protein